MNARGGTVADRLRNIPSRVREVASYGAYRGAATAIDVVSTMFGADYRQFHSVFPEWSEARGEFEELVDDLNVVADAIIDDISLDAVVGSIFGEE